MTHPRYNRTVEAILVIKGYCMKRSLQSLWITGLMFLSAACASQPAPPSKPVDVLSWDRNPDTVVFQVRQAIEGEDPILAKSRLPLCTVFGNNRIVWITLDPKAGPKAFETQVDDTTIISFLEFLIRDEKFYGIPDYIKQDIPPAVTPPDKIVVSSIGLFLNNELRTVSSYRPWPGNAFQTIYDRCTKLSTTTAVYKPSSVFISAFQLPSLNGGPTVEWPNSAPFRLAETAQSKVRQQLSSGPLLDLVWQISLHSQGTVQWTENGKQYLIGVEIPGLTPGNPDVATAAPTKS
jgi:hypothetical protein